MNRLYMKNISLLFFVALFMSLCSCGPKVATQITSSEKIEVLAYDKEVYVFNTNDSLPPVIKELGTIEIGDSGFSTNCNYETVISTAIEETRKAGGNGLLIISHKLPDFWSSCHRIVAKVLLIDTDLVFKTRQIQPAITDSAGYALLHIYRTSTMGMALNYDLHLGDIPLCTVKNNYAQTIKVTKDDRNTLWAKTESKTEVPINIEFGKEYYIYCATKMGVFVGRPTIMIVDPAVGEKIFQAILTKKQQKK